MALFSVYPTARGNWAEASDLRDALDSFAFGLRKELGVATEHAIFRDIATARAALDHITRRLATRAIDGDTTEAPAACDGQRRASA